MTNSCPETIKANLERKIKTMSATPTPFVKKPASDFTRKRKLDFETFLKFTLSMEGWSTRKELLDYLPVGSTGEYEITFRVVRFPISEDSYETIITNLDATEFSAIQIRELYRLRWGIETSFRDLKYAIGLTHSF